jgi:hypothetical protein
MKTMDPGRLLSLSMSSEVIMCSAPGSGSGRGFDPCGDHDVASLKRANADPNAIRPGECVLSLDHLDFAARNGAREAFRDVLDYVLSRAIRARPSPVSACRLQSSAAQPARCRERLSGSDQHLLWVQPRLGRVSPRSRGSITATHRSAAGHADAGIATADDHNVEFLIGLPFVNDAKPPDDHLLVMVEVIDLTTIVAMLNWASRSRML